MKLLILSNIHGNLSALEAVLNAEPDFDAAAFAGDVVDYGPNPVECIRWLRDSAHYKVRGNHDNALAFNVDCQCLPITREFSTVTRAWHRSLVSENDLQFLRTIPTLDWFEWDGKHFRLAHGTPYGNFEFLPMDRWEECIRGLDNDYVILGNSHVQGMKTFGKTTVVNPGSVGLARDHPGKACYCVFDGREATLKHVPYDVERTVTVLRQAPLPTQVIEGLSFLLRG
jgi:putative phosphoesterase